jgi:N-dimethylarginine dimethylaminohydrolase
MSAIPFGAASSTAPLRHVLVKTPDLSFSRGYPDFGFRHHVGLVKAQTEHRDFTRLLSSLGVTVHQLGRSSTSPDATYQYDTSIVTDSGAIMLRSGKPSRVGEEELQAAWFESIDLPIIARIEAPGTVDGGDVCWLRDGVACIGRSLRTNQDGIDQLAPHLDGEVHVFDVPFDAGEDECLHLMSVISPITDNIAVVEPNRLPSGLYRLMEELQILMIAIPPEDVHSLACNILVIEPGLVVMVEGNPQTQGFLENQGIEVHAFAGTEICLNGNGGPTCLTKPIRRG